MLLEHYPDERPIDRLIGSGAIARLASTPGNSITYFRHYKRLWGALPTLCVPRGTEWFFANYWSSAPEWQEWLRRTREFQRPQPIHSLIRAYRPQQPSSGQSGS